ncbi:MAG: amidohydrolase family protein [Bradymonadaceae bacterium]
MIIDMHVHLIGTREDNGCLVSPRLASGFVYYMLSRVLGMHRADPERLDDAFRDKLVEWVEDSDLDGIGVLAFDAVYDESGQFDFERTHFYVSNDYCLDFCERSSKLLPICSVNPQRHDAIEELERVVSKGSVAIKLLPNTQGIDLLNPAYDEFWKRMAALGIPLLSHTSFEHTLPVIDQKFGKPERLRAPLGHGVKVIAAHCAGSGVAHPFREDFGTWLKMLEDYPTLYGDVSAMASLARFPYIHKVLKHELARERILLGSDFPIPVSPVIFTPQLGLRRVRELSKIANPLQRNLEVFRALGCDETMLRRSTQVLKL